MKHVHGNWKMKWFQYGSFMAAAALSLAINSVAFANPSEDQQLELARIATAAYLDVNNALADGYVPVGGCISDPVEGAMGIHYINFDLLMDPSIDYNKPDMLLYMPSANGKPVLVALDWWVADSDQNLATTNDRPYWYNRPFDGPYDGSMMGMPNFYDRHVWAWSYNPDGDFSRYNRLLHCPSEPEEEM